MDDPNNSTSTGAIAATMATDAAPPAPMTPELGEQYAAAQAKAAELIKLPIEKLKVALAGLSIFELARVLEAEKAEGEGKTRTGALAVIEDAAEKVASQAAADRQQPQAPVDGGPVDLELDGVDITPESAADRIAASAAAEPSVPTPAAPLTAGSERIELADMSGEYTARQVLELVLANGAAIVIGRPEFGYRALPPIEAKAWEFSRAPYGDRVLYNSTVALDGAGITPALPLEQAWLVTKLESGEPVIIRRCDIGTPMMLAEGTIIELRAGFLAF